MTIVQYLMQANPRLDLEKPTRQLFHKTKKIKCGKQK